MSKETSNSSPHLDGVSYNQLSNSATKSGRRISSDSTTESSPTPRSTNFDDDDVETERRRQTDNVGRRKTFAGWTLVSCWTTAGHRSPSRHAADTAAAINSGAAAAAAMAVAAIAVAASNEGRKEERTSEC